MTKKHFIALADVVRDSYPPPAVGEVDTIESSYRLGAYQQWREMQESLADFCQSQNRNFNRQLWLDYIAGKCGPNGGKV